MTVQSDLRKAIAAAQQALGDYSSFAAATQDPKAKEIFAAMAHDMGRTQTIERQAELREPERAALTSFNEEG